jgi:UDP:flavonoid glycosyltransferase YjiC (YdhE family)
VPHGRVLPYADAVVTHAGHGTVIAALAHGLPLVCLPMGRDQHDNAARVAWHGAGLRLSSTSSPARIAAALRTVLDHTAYREAAQRIAKAIIDERPSHAGPDELESLAATRT